jgi:hypothetical protein
MLDTVVAKSGHREGRGLEACDLEYSCAVPRARRASSGWDSGSRTCIEQTARGFMYVQQLGAHITNVCYVTIYSFWLVLQLFPCLFPITVG